MIFESKIIEQNKTGFLPDCNHELSLNIRKSNLSDLAQQKPARSRGGCHTRVPNPGTGQCDSLHPHMSALNPRISLVATDCDGPTCKAAAMDLVTCSWGLHPYYLNWEVMDTNPQLMTQCQRMGAFGGTRQPLHTSHRGATKCCMHIVTMLVFPLTRY